MATRTVNRRPALLLASCRGQAVGLLVLAALSTALLIPSSTARGQDPEILLEDQSVASVDDGPTFPIGAISLRYLRDNPLHPPLEEAMLIPIELGETTTGFVAPRPEVPVLATNLQELSARPTETYHASAIQHVIESLRDHFVAQDLLGLYVSIDPTQISETGIELRAAGDSAITFIITTGIVTEMRTIASGERVKEGGDLSPATRIDNPLHQRVMDRSPLRPYTEGDPVREDLLRRDELDRYLFFLGRHPGRRVDGSIAAAEEIGGLALDYMVTENTPLTLYAEVSNTGTRSTDYWRQRLGFFHTQLTDNDDILTFDYTTANFSDVHSFAASYEAPFENDRVRWRVIGGYTFYNADQLGFFDDEFDGDSWTIGGQISWNFYQERELFWNLYGGARFAHAHVDNKPFAIDGAEDFVFWEAGLLMDRTTERYSTRARLGFEWQIGDVTDVDDLELNELGRTDPDRDWIVFKGNFQHSFFLEPVLDPEAWADPSTPESSTLAHEIRLRASGQYAFDNRLIPQSEAVVGGLYSVRGYPQSVVAGDSTFIGSLEYRYHVPRAFGIQREPKELFGEAFRAAPQYVFGSPDWDLILKGFVDVGYTWISDKLSFEDDYTLVGMGVGVEFLYRRNVSMRLDWGFTMDDLEQADVNSGSNRLHFVATFLF